MGIKDLLNSDERRLLLFGGKGGVGKTSVAAAAAVYAAERGKKTLIISSDPAHSLSDVFEQPQLNSGVIEKIEHIENLYGLEISPKEVLSDYQHYLDEYPEYKIIIGETLENFPGSNEGFGLLNIIRMYRYENYDLVIVDTAPTGHTLRLLSFPDFLNTSMMRLIRLRHALGSLFGKFSGFFRRKKKGDTAEKDPVELLEKMKTWSIEAREWLTKDEISFIIVMIPELLSIYETERLITELRAYKIQISGLIINKLFPETTDCEFCQAKRRSQDQNLQLIQERFVELSPKFIPFLKSEVHGLNVLRLLSKFWD